jgi:cellulose synthase/poly-beta-1,6-N-acetylglucosamine synthase-like glycosyltransferase
MVAAAVLGVTLSLVLALPSAFFMIECLWSTRRKRPGTVPRRAPRVVVMMPAHDEERVIEATLIELLGSLDRGMSVLVVADNCSDRTAEIAETAGARVVCRNDETRIGKGYALEFGVRALEADPPDVIVVLDADCKIDPFSLRRIADLAHHTGKPVQAEYKMKPSDDSLFARISAFAFAVRNRVRARGLKRMGIPVQLGGTGMAFPFNLLRSAPSLGGFLAEDFLLGLEMVLAGRAPILAEETSVISFLPANTDAAKQQRRRWEGGSLALVRSHGSRVVKDAIHYKRPQLVGFAIDLAIPPLALLVLLSSVVLIVLATAVFVGAPSFMLGVGALPLVFVAVGVGVAWRSVGREILPLRQLILAPLYVMWKLPLYLAMALRGLPARWERTAREPSE